MEIMMKVANRLRQKSGLNYIVRNICTSTFVVVILLRIVNGDEMFSNEINIFLWNDQWNWYFLWIGITWMIIHSWIYFVPTICTNMERLKGAFESEEYCKLYKKNRRWMGQFNLWNHGRSLKFTLIYDFFWGLFLLAFWSFIWTCFDILNLSLLSTLLFEMLGFIVIILNFSSLYICIVFVYFLIWVYKLGQKRKLKYIEELPSATYGLQVLCHTVNVIWLYVFLNSMFCVVTGFCTWKIIVINHFWFSDKNWIIVLAFLYITFFLVVFGLVACVTIILLTKSYLRKLHNEWKFQSSEMFEKEYQHNIKNRFKREHIVLIMEKLKQDKLSMNGWEMLISLVAFAANIVTVGSIFGIW